MLRAMPDLTTATPEELRAASTRVFRQGLGTRPQVSLIELEGQRAVLKDFTRCAPWFGWLFGPLLAYREARALRLLQGVRGVPALIRQVNSRAILMAYVDGKTAKELPKASLHDPAFFERVYALTDAMHARGVAHCDLRSGGNTVIDGEGQPWFVDFVSHFVQGAPWNLPWRWVFRQFCRADHIGVTRLKRRLAPELLTDADRQELELDKKHPVGRIARFIGHGIRDLGRLILPRKKR